MVVRLMKEKKEVIHNDLMELLYKELKFPVIAADVKKTIDGLIEKDYIKRSSLNTLLYEYVA